MLTYKMGHLRNQIWKHFPKHIMLPAERSEFSKNKLWKKWEENLDQMLTYKGENLDQIITLHHAHIHIYIYICMLWCYYLGQICFYTVCQKHYKNWGFSIFLKTNCVRKFEVLLSGPSWPFLSCIQLGPNNNTYLAQIITPQYGLFFQMFAFKNVLKYLFL